MADIRQMAVPDGLPTRESGDWAEKKLDYLRRYVDAFVTSMRNKWRLYYIDLFAGPGKCRIRGTDRILLGSPLIALNSRYPFATCYFVDLDPGNLDALRQRCEFSPLYAQERIHFMSEDANVAASDIVDIIRRQPLALGLAFLDPEGLELHWETVATLAQLARLDLIINYSQMGLTRNMDDYMLREDDTAADRFFGGREWRAIYGRYQRREVFYRHSALIKYYRAKLHQLGYKHALLNEPLMRNSKGGPLYRLLFASKHERGNEFWQKITATDVDGQRRLLEFEPPYE